MRINFYLSLFLSSCLYLQATASRRVCLHSKQEALNAKGILGSTMWFILFQDSLAIVQMFTQKEIPLVNLWIEDMDESENGFRLITPNEKMELIAPSAEVLH